MTLPTQNAVGKATYRTGTVAIIRPGRETEYRDRVRIDLQIAAQHIHKKTGFRLEIIAMDDGGAPPTLQDFHAEIRQHFDSRQRGIHIHALNCNSVLSGSMIPPSSTRSIQNNTRATTNNGKPKHKHPKRKASQKANADEDFLDITKEKLEAVSHMAWELFRVQILGNEEIEASARSFCRILQKYQTADSVDHDALYFRSALEEIIGSNEEDEGAWMLRLPLYEPGHPGEGLPFEPSPYVQGERVPPEIAEPTVPSG